MGIKQTLVVLGVIVTAAMPALGSPTVYGTLGGSSDLQENDDTRIEARFRVDTTNWDSRLEFDSYPNYGDTTGHVGNGTSFFENKTFGLVLSYADATDTATWTITAPSGAQTTLTQDVTGFDQLNTMQIYTSGSRGDVSLSNLVFDGLGMNFTSFPDLNTAPSPAVTFKETFLYFGTDLLSNGDWTMSGDVSFGTFTKSNPSEGTKVVIKLRDAHVVPEPAGLLMLVLGGATVFIRRKSSRTM